jgi:hypothetical protein
MANRKISDLTALTAPVSGDLLPIVDISEAAAADKNKKITIQSLFQGIPVNVGIGISTPARKLDVNGSIQLPSNNALYINGSNNYLYADAVATELASSTVIKFVASGSERVRIDSSGRLLVGGSPDSGGALLQVFGDRIRIGTAKTPASATATGTTGEIAWDANYIYVCTATNTWKRTAIATW